MGVRRLGKAGIRVCVAPRSPAAVGSTDRGDEALDQLNAACDSYLHHEALADARRVGRELRWLGVQRRIVTQPRAKAGWDSLTDSELQVVNLIATGTTEVVPVFVEFEVAVPHLSPAGW